MNRPPTAKAKLDKRLSGYWKMEGINIIAVPLLMAWLADWQLGLASFVALIPMCALLAIGTIYWRSKLQQLREGQSLPRSIALLAKLQFPTLILTIIGAASATLAWVSPGSASGPGDRWVATAAATLAVLEYVNYYHRQLQHFDHAADWKRLISGRGFRPSQMSVDIARWRRHSEQ